MQTTDAVIITGSGRGIGAATALLAARGYGVCVNYRENRVAAESVVNTIRDAGGHAIAVQGDVSMESDVTRLFDTCERTLFLCAREAVWRMSVKAGGSGGAIVNLSSIAARLGAPGEYVDYAASKGAIDTMTVGLAREVAADGIRVNAVRAGYIYTDMHASGGEPGRVDRLKDGIPMKRGGTPEEVAEAILWLLSDAASYTTGSFLDVSGGR
jgi:NAD(P)-dependent dehydrogenase (short-subunit alcohol dehydrogenase family)